MQHTAARVTTPRDGVRITTKPHPIRVEKNGRARLAPMILRPMTPADLPGVLAVQAACYEPAYHEPQVAFHAKLTQCADTCWVMAQDASVAAYLVCLPVTDAALPALHQADWQRPRRASALYLHDLAVSPTLRGSGAASRLIEQAIQAARASGLSSLVLVAVQGSVPFWQRHGFEDARLPDAKRPASLQTFGPTATFMTRPA